MITAYRKKAIVNANCRFEINTPALKPGTKTEIIILVDEDIDEKKPAYRMQKNGKHSSIKHRLYHRSEQSQKKRYLRK